MPSYNEYLHESLRLLYEYLLNFKVSIDLIQKLAQHLRLDTFVDSEVTDPETNQLVKRLSIAGSLLLVDIDFKDQNTVTKVSLASGNHLTSAVSTALSHLEEKSVISTTKIDNTTVVRVNFLDENVLSFLNVRGDDDRSVAEKNLKENLNGPRLGNFPLNLKYLANLDRLSPPEGDLVLYLDNIAKYLEVIHMQECKLNPDDDGVKSGQTSLLGKLLYNDADSYELGVFLQFWKTHNKFPENERSYFKPKTYVGRLSVIESENPARDYLKEATKALWEPKDKDGNFLEYKITFDDDKHLPKGVPVSGPNTRNWLLQFGLNQAVYLPREIVDYLDFDAVEEAEEPALKEVFSKIEKFGSVDFALESGPTILLDLSSYSSFVPVSAFTLSSLNSISKLLTSLRNFTLLTSWVESVVKQPECQVVGSTETDNKKQRDHPALTEEELLGLNTMSESNNYVGVQVLDSNTNTDLEDFVKQEDEDEHMDKDNVESTAVTPVPQEPYLRVYLDDISFSSKDIDLQFAVSARTSSGSAFEAGFKLQNGAFVKEDYSEKPQAKRFINALELSEDLLLALKIVN